MTQPLKRIIQFLLACLLVFFSFFIYHVFTIVSGYGAKTLCSAIFIGGRQAEDVASNELGGLPFKLGTYSIDFKDSSVTASVFGFTQKKAKYISGIGAVLINDIAVDSAPVNRLQSYVLPRFDTVRPHVMWPDGDIIEKTPFVTLDNQRLQAVVARAFVEPGKKALRRTRSVVVVYNGKIVAERYAPGFSMYSKQPGWSMAKSITNAMVGILVKNGQLDINRPAPVSEWKHDERSHITTKQLMQMNSGLRWWDFYLGPSDATDMLFNENDMGGYALKSPLEHKPGSVFSYSGGSANIVSKIVRQTLGDNRYYRFPYDSLFHKIGMYNTLLEVDAAGTFVGSSYCYATARDWARFGLLYLNDGLWNGERILPEGWVKFTATVSSAENNGGAGSYGALWWVNKPLGTKPLERKYPHVPEDCFSCEGYEGQSVWVIPSKKLVVVRLSQEEGNKLDRDKFLAEIIASLPKENNREWLVSK